MSAFLSQSIDLIGGTPHGVKLGHTMANGDPAAAGYPGALKFTVTGAVGGVIAESGQGCAGTGGFVPRLEGSGCATPGRGCPIRVTGSVDRRLFGMTAQRLWLRDTVGFDFRVLLRAAPAR